MPKQQYPFGRAGKTNTVAASMPCIFEGALVKLTKQLPGLATNFPETSMAFNQPDNREKYNTFELVHSYYKLAIPSAHPQALQQTKALAKTSDLE